MSNNNNESKDFLDDLSTIIRDHFFQNQHQNGLDALSVCEMFTDDYYDQGFKELEKNKENIHPDSYPEVMKALMCDVWEYYGNCLKKGDMMIPIRQITNPDELNNYIVGNADSLYLQFGDYQCFLWYRHLQGRISQDDELKNYINQYCDGIVCLLQLVRDIEIKLVRMRIESTDFKDAVTSLFKQSERKQKKYI